MILKKESGTVQTFGTIKRDHSNSITPGSSPQQDKSVGSRGILNSIVIHIALLSFLRTLLVNSDQLKFDSNKFSGF